LELLASRVAEGHPAMVREVLLLFEAAGFEGVIIVKDLSDRDRVITNGPDPRTNPIPKM
jgi:release factor glutamine methyltransferase